MQENNLFQLIKKLSPPEKRYFKLFASRQGDKKSYMDLFNALDEMDTYDEKKLRKKLGKASLGKQLPVLRNYLAELILRSLRSYYDERSADARIMNLIRETEVLFSKSLYRMCAKLLLRAEQLAAKNEKFYLLLEVYRWQRRLVTAEMKEGFGEELRQNIQKEAELFRLMENVRGYNELFTESVLIVKKYHTEIRSAEEKEPYDRLMMHPLLSDESMALSFEARLRFWQLHSNAAVTSRDLEKGYYCNLKQVKLFEENPLQMEALFDMYLESINNLMNRSMQLKKFDEVKELLEKLNRLTEEYPSLMSEQVRVKTFARVSNQFLSLHLDQGSISEALHRIPQLEEGLEHYGNRMNWEQKLVLCYNLAYVYFMNGKYSDALRHTNAIIDEADPELRQDLQSFARIMQLIIHTELHNMDALPYFIRSTYRYLTQRKKLFRFETLVLNSLRRLPPAFDREALTAFYSKLHTEALPLLEDTFERQAFDYFDLIAWLESKLEKISFEEARKRALVGS